MDTQLQETADSRRLIMIEKDGHRYLVPANYEIPSKQKEQQQKQTEPK